MLRWLGTLQWLLPALAVGALLVLFAAELGWWDPLRLIEDRSARVVEEDLRPRAEAGDADAQNRMGLYYWTTARGPEDYRTAVGWFRGAAARRHGPAMVNLALAYRMGRGVDADRDQAIEWFYRAGRRFLEAGFPLDAVDCVQHIADIDPDHPRRRELAEAIRAAHPERD